MDLPRGAPKHDHLHAVVVVEVHVQGGDDVFAEVVLHLREALGELAHVVVVDEGEGGHGGAVGLEVGLDERAAHEVAQGLGARGVAPARDERVEAVQQVVVHRDAEANELGSHVARESTPRRASAVRGHR